ncbi:serine/threonine-protein kinase Nek11-like isoform X2 [Ruditapes philippinarum]|uniref:serine/threonine-protein kinase Nek11-like isoform X2 n=1 Tax=Ruditapes philippinarum TaxID=129788 RepID=UPI00295AD884|nr:serine/threonine-protein kinase Nek11-like isoform X2 [Ruditapes philippinarum]
MSTRKKSKEQRILANRYQVVSKLGKGNFGTAFLCKDLRHSKSQDEEAQFKVMKEISVGDLQPDETVDAMHEARLLSKLDHPSIVQFHDSFIDGEYFCIVTEYCEGGDLDMKIQEYKKLKKQFDEKLVLDWFVQLLLAVHYMHSRRVLHRDLKTRNIFLKKNRVKIGDFGISRILMGTTDLASTFTGTPYYMSPEVLKHEGYNSKSDVWSIGCILYEMCSLDHAFDGKSLMAVMYKIVEGEPPDLPTKYSKDLNKVLKLMLNKDPEKRPSATELIKVPLISAHIAKMSEEYQAKHNSQDSNHANSDAVEIAKALREKSRLDDLRKSEDDIKFKNLPPRERMRLQKMQKADREAKRLSEVARVQLIENQQRRTAIQQTLFKPSIPAWQGGSGEGIDLKSALTVKSVGTKPANKDFGTRSAPMVLYDDDKSSDEDEQQQTIKFNPMRTAGGPPTEQYLPKTSATSPDERAITPLKDKMVYDKVFSSLDFKDGIPESPALANTYYSQFEDDFTPSDDDDDDENAVTVVAKKGVAGSGTDDDDDIQFGSGTLTRKDDDDEFYNHLQYVLDKDNDAEGTLTLADDVEAGAFGPVARESKIKNLRAECEKMLGAEAFSKAYDYLKTARYERANEATEEDIMQGLRDFVKNPSDCFLVDQLLFLEEQHGTASL